MAALPALETITKTALRARFNVFELPILIIPVALLCAVSSCVYPVIETIRSSD
jgi:hypothetical protein